MASSYQLNSDQEKDQDDDEILHPDHFLVNSVDEPVVEKLSRIDRKKILKLCKSGMSYTSAEDKVLSEKKEKIAEMKLIAHPISPKISKLKFRKHQKQIVKPISIKACVINSNYPTDLLTDQQLIDIRSHIYQALDDISQEEPKIRFLGCNQKFGMLIIKCLGKETLQWLNQTIENSILPDKYKIKIVDVFDLPGTNVYQVFIPNDVNKKLSPEKVLNRLRVQNHKLQTNYWKVLSCEEYNVKIRLWTFAVDDESLVELEILGFKPFYSFQRLKFTTTKRSKMK